MHQPEPTRATACPACGSLHTPHPLYAPCCSPLCLRQWADAVAARRAAKASRAAKPKRPRA